jgi:uncharacterized protein (TIGR02217 family)
MFNESRILDRVAYGSQFGMEFSTRINSLRSGVERRNANWSAPLCHGSLMYQNLDYADHALVRDAHMACMGSLVAFRFKDWTDYQADAQVIGEGSGVEQALQLVKVYTFGPLALSRPIKKPVSGTASIFEDGVVTAAVIDYTTGLVTLTAAPGSVITWSGEFDVPVRFVSDRLDSDPVARRQAGFILSSDVDLIEVRL